MEKNKKIKKTSSSDSSKQEHYTQILLEDMNSKIQLMAEQHSSSSRSLEYLRNKADKHDEDIELLLSLSRTHSESIKRVENRLDNVENKLEGVENRLEGVENRLEGVENKLDVNIANHEKRISKLEETAISR